MQYILDIRGFSKVRAQFTRKGNGAGGYTYMPLAYRMRQWKAVEALREFLPILNSYNWPRIKKEYSYAPGKWFKDQGFEPLYSDLLRVDIIFEFNKSTKADKDNLEGGILDAFNCILWKDDSLIKDGRVKILEQSGINRVTINIDTFIP